MENEYSCQYVEQCEGSFKSSFCRRKVEGEGTEFKERERDGCERKRRVRGGGGGKGGKGGKGGE
jgi:hypothetical protein